MNENAFLPLVLFVCLFVFSSEIIISSFIDTTRSYKIVSPCVMSRGVLGTFHPLLSGVRQSVKMLTHACMTSSVLQIAASTDLFFASFVPNAAAGLGYANLLAFTPLGILSTSLMVRFSLSLGEQAAAAFDFFPCCAPDVTVTVTDNVLMLFFLF